jgi:hypothetical protein
LFQVDPTFKVIARAYPHVISQLIRDRSPAMRSILSSLVLTHSGNIRWKRLERLIHEAELAGPNSSGSFAVISNHDIFAVTADALRYLLSDGGARVRYGLVNDAVNAVDAAIEEHIVSLRDPHATPDLVERISPVLSTVSSVISEAPLPWLRLMGRTLSNPEAHLMLQEAVNGAHTKSGWRVPQYSLLQLSHALHAAEDHLAAAAASSCASRPQPASARRDDDESSGTRR